MDGLDLNEKLNLIRDKLGSEYYAANKNGLIELDFEFNLLLSAAQSYKHETVLKPFPRAFNDNNEELLKTLLSMPPVSVWKLKLNDFNEKQILLIYTFLTNAKPYDLLFRPDLTTDDLLKLTGATATTAQLPKPNYIFELKHNSEEKLKKFEQLKKDFNVQYAYHGSRFENFYSICNIGLLAHMNKTSLFGEGTYLSLEPTISLHYSPSCTTWSKSLISQRMSCLLICETICDPVHVKLCQKDIANNNNGTTTATTTTPNDLKPIAQMKTTDEAPERYFIVRNNEYTRVKYILLYCDAKRKNSVTSSALVSTTARLRRYISNNKFLLVVLSYCVLLLSVSLFNSRAFHKYVKLSYRKFTTYLMGDTAATYD